MILAAGRGSRLNEITYKTPKPLVKVNGKPLLEYHLDSLERAGFKQVVINVSWLSEQIRHYIDNSYQGRLQITIYHEEQALETGGGVFAALQDLSENNQPFLVINSDVLSNFDFSQVPHQIQGLAHMYLVNNPIEHPEGDFCLDPKRGLLLKPARSLDTPKQALTFSGISVLTPALFTQCRVKKFSLAELFKKYIPLGLITAEHFEHQWFDVGTIERLKLAERWQRSQ